MSHIQLVGQSHNLLASARTRTSHFIWNGNGPSLFAQYFASVHVPLPNAAFWIAAIIHLVGGLAVPVGFKTRWAAALLALLSVATALGVHLPSGDQEHTINFYKNLVMTGGFLCVIAFGAGTSASAARPGSVFTLFGRHVGDGSRCGVIAYGLARRLYPEKPT
ncbi:DoxX family protein [Bradyrhizobium sp. SEMIA]|uniref:DoxX family protein n=1 Tax=Bradyrhizobium sp. SEMIA TaxID=2597515 RepID=UPI003A0FC58B